MERLSLFYLLMLTAAVLTGISDLYSSTLNINVFEVVRSQTCISYHSYIQSLHRITGMYQIPNPGSILFLIFGIISMAGIIKRNNERN